MTGPALTPGAQTPVPQPTHTAPAAHKGTSGLAITGLVLGIVAIAFSWFFLTTNFAIIHGFVGLVLAIIAIVVTAKRDAKKKGKGMAIAGAVLSVVALVIAFSIQASISSAVDSLTSSSSQSSDDSSDDKTDDSTDTVEEAEKPAAADGEGDLSEIHVKITSVAKGPADYAGKPTVVVTVDWTNTSDSNQMLSIAGDPKVYQNGKSLDTAIFGTQSPEGYDAMDSLNELKAGASATTLLAYTLDDETADVEVQLSDPFNDSVSVSKTFSLQ